MEQATVSHLRPATPIRCGATWIVPLVRVDVRVVWRSERLFGEAAKRPEALVILGPPTPRALDLEGRPLDAERLFDEIPELRGVARRLGGEPA